MKRRPRATAVVIALALMLGSMLLDGLATWTVVRGEHVQAVSIAWLLGWPLLLAAAAWWTVTSWRNEDATIFTKAMVLPPVAWLLATAIVHVGPHISEALGLARGADRTGSLELKLADSSRTLRISGRIGLGDAARVQDILIRLPDLYRVDLVSTGGRQSEAQAIARVIAAHGVSTWAAGACERACTLIFLAGHRRQWLPEGRLGFQRLIAPSFNPLVQYFVRNEQAQTYGSAGLPPALLNKMLLTAAPHVWRPDRAEVAGSGVLSVPDFVLDVDLPPPSGSGADEYVQALSTNPTWQALERRWPGVWMATADLMLAARKAPQAAGDSADSAALLSAHQVALKYLQVLLTGASDELRQMYIALLVEQLVALDTPTGCQLLLAGDSAVRRTLPESLAVREAEWMEAASAETSSGRALRPVSRIEDEVIHRSLGERSANSLAHLWTAGVPGIRPLDCEGGRALSYQVLRLPVPERRLALRRVFERSGH